MDRPNRPYLPTLSSSNNPFLNLQSRYLVLGTYLIASIVLGMLYGMLGQLSLMPKLAGDAISVPILSIAIWTVMASVILLVGKTQGLQLKYLLGPRGFDHPNKDAPRLSYLYAGLLVASLLIFSLGSFSVVFYVIAALTPDYAADILETNLMLGGGGSNYPQLYDGLMAFLLLVYAPLVEELVFRGILLQRWGMKWGLRWGVVASSLLFGLLHVNNPLGLTLFGLAMGLLYVRTQCLWVPIFCHALNNLAAIAIDSLSKASGSEQAYTVAEVQDSWSVGLLLIAISAPFLGHFIWRSWPRRGDKIPYLLNVGWADGDKVG